MSYTNVRLHYLIDGEVKICYARSIRDALWRARIIKNRTKKSGHPLFIDNSIEAESSAVYELVHLYGPDWFGLSLN